MRGKQLALCVFLSVATGSSALAGDLFKPSVQDQIKLGQRAAEGLRDEMTILEDDDPRVLELRRLGRTLVMNIPEEEREAKPFQYTFDVVDSEEINAFALPGGPVFFFTGLLEKIETEDQLISILAHEMTHVQKEHWASAYADQQKRQIGLLLLLVLLDANDTLFNVAAVSDELLFTLPFSRRHESEADRIGYDMVVEASFNPQGMVDVFKMLKEVAGGGGGKFDEYFSTHPTHDRRIRDIEERIEKSETEFPEQIKREIGLLRQAVASSVFLTVRMLASAASRPATDLNAAA
ncbi:MAG: M48 family metalloprotease [Armatimonadetes bacterium]|nr:M48 family metalloprotease [Armatimonadota bacterium]